MRHGVTPKIQDLFWVAKGCALVQSIAQDLRMETSIDTIFKRKFGGIEDLR